MTIHIASAMTGIASVGAIMLGQMDGSSLIISGGAGGIVLMQFIIMRELQPIKKQLADRETETAVLIERLHALDERVKVLERGR